MGEANQQLVVTALSAQRLHAAAERAAQRRTAFMAALADELRNPIAPTRVSSAMLSRESAVAPLLPRMQEVLDLSQQQMLRLLNAALDCPRPGPSAAPG